VKQGYAGKATATVPPGQMQHSYLTALPFQMLPADRDHGQATP